MNPKCGFSWIFCDSFLQAPVIRLLNKQLQQTALRLFLSKLMRWVIVSEGSRYNTDVHLNDDVITHALLLVYVWGLMCRVSVLKVRCAEWHLSSPKGCHTRPHRPGLTQQHITLQSRRPKSRSGTFGCLWRGPAWLVGAHLWCVSRGPAWEEARDHQGLFYSGLQSFRAWAPPLWPYLTWLPEGPVSTFSPIGSWGFHI